MKIIKYHARYQTQVLYLQKKALVAINAWKGDGPWDNDLKAIDDIYDDENGFFLLGIENDRVVAMGALYIDNSSTAEIRRFRVDPEWQGRGFAGQIFRSIETIAIEHRIQRLYLDTGVMQTAARRFYEKMGFAEFGRKTIWDMPCVLYEKYLKSFA